jgi:hypothetical protein
LQSGTSHWKEKAGTRADLPDYPEIGPAEDIYSVSAKELAASNTFPFPKLEHANIGRCSK